MNGKQDRQFQQLIDIIAIMGQHSIGYGRIEIVRPTIGVRQTRYTLEQHIRSHKCHSSEEPSGQAVRIMVKTAAK